MQDAHTDFREIAAARAEDVSRALGVDPTQGLTASEVSARRARHGANRIPRPRTTVPALLRRQLTAPFALLLVGAAIVSFLIGEPVDASMIALFVAINAALGFFQEYRAERAVEQLMHYWEERVHAVRGGATVVVASADLVPGDIVTLQAGDKVPADVRLIDARGLTVDESTLTGESGAAAKDAAAMPAEPHDTFDSANILFMGTAVLTGEAHGIVFATGTRTTTGAIASTAAHTATASSFDREIAGFGKFTLRLVMGTLAALTIAHIAMRGWSNVGELALFAIALTVGAIPEALPVVATIAMSMGASRLAKRKVIVKRLSAIEDLGSIDVLCTDKTGTLTQNVMQVAGIRTEDEERCLRLAVLGSSILGEKRRGQNNAFDLALWKRAPAAMRAECRKARKLGEEPFDPVRRRNSTLIEDGGRTLLVTRGSPDEVFPLCTHLGDELALGKFLAAEGAAGRRVLAIASKDHADADAPIAPQEHGLRFVGCISFHDPLKRDAGAAVRRAQGLGVRVKVLTGDSKEVSGSVARTLGLIDDPTKVMTGAEFDALEPGAQVTAARDIDVFARMNPRQKFAVLALLRETHTVGFLGEGFNDAPGLKMAHVGIAVEGASDVAKSSADVILLARGLGVICDGIVEGRRTFANTVKYLKVTLAGNLGNFYSVAIASFFIPYLPMRPTQLLLVNLLTDVPMIALAGDQAEASELKKPRMIDPRSVIFAATMFGIVSSAIDLATFQLFVPYGERPLQTLWFMVSVLCELALIYSLRTERQAWQGARPSLGIVALSIAAAAGAILLPLSTYGDRWFGFAAPTTSQLLSAGALVAMAFVITEAVKWALPKNGHNGEKKSMRE